jgi:hypothetical protein
MATEDGVTTPPAAPADGGAAPSSAPALDANELAELRAYREQAAQAFTTLEPVSEDINWMLADEANREFIREARRTYEESRRSREPALDPNTKRVLDEIAPLREFVTAAQKREQDAVKREQQAYAQKTRSVRDRLVAERPWLAEHNDAGVFAIAAFGDRMGITDLAEAAKAFDAAGQPKGVTPPRSLRSEGSAAGVPGPSSAPPIKSAKDIRARLKHAFANQGR